MKIKRKKRNGGFITLAQAMYIAAMTVAPFVVSGALELWEADAEYPQSIYGK